MRKHPRNCVKYRDGEIVFREGSAGKKIYFVLGGKAEVSRDIGGEKRTTAILSKDDFFGEMAALNGDARSMTVTAIGELLLRELSLDEMLDYMQRNHDILKDVCANFAKRLRDTNLKLEELTLKTVTSNGREEDWMTDAADTDGLNILAVDDDPNTVAAVEDLLSDKYNVFTAFSGKDALSLMEQYDIALVLTDYRMPGMMGTELLENVKNMHPDAIRMIYGKHTDQRTLMKAVRDVQAHEVLPKPCMDEEIIFSLARWTEQYRKTKWLKEKANQDQHTVVVQKQLEEANKLIQQLKQEARQVSTSELHHGSQRKNWFRKNRLGGERA
ncbi:cyclic nucleotide-binding domain-containing protein [Candidatus Poribacteria bacterium]